MNPIKILALYQRYYPKGMNYLFGPRNDVLKLRLLGEHAKKHKIPLTVEVGFNEESLKLHKDADIVFFSGHGSTSNGENVLVLPRDSKVKFSHLIDDDDLISSGEIAKHQLLLLDCCFAGGFKSVVTMHQDKFGVKIKKARVKNYQMERIASTEYAHEGIFASAANEYSYDVSVNGNYGGAFTWALLNSAVALRCVTTLDQEMFEDHMTSLCYGLGAHQHPIVRISNDKWPIIVDFIKLLGDLIKIIRQM